MLDNARLECSWVVPYGMRGFKEWYTTIGFDLEPDVVVVEKFEARDNDKSKDNSVLETIAFIEMCFPDLILQRNAGYKSDIPDNLLKNFGSMEILKKSHHQDCRAAARLDYFGRCGTTLKKLFKTLERW